MAENTLDRIHIIDLLLRCVVGITEEERRDRQDVIINVTLHADLALACASDDISDAVDYKAVKKSIIMLLEREKFELIEAMAEKIAQACLDDQRVRRADVKVEKPGALRFAKSVAVEISRFNETDCA
jgi:FolB domain-containing protein